MRSLPIAICVGWSAALFTADMMAKGSTNSGTAEIATVSIMVGIAAVFAWWERKKA